MSKDKQTEIHELAKQMSKAISTEVEQKYIMEEAKLEAVLRANGWVKAEEIFAEIETSLHYKLINGEIHRRLRNRYRILKRLYLYNVFQFSQKRRNG